MAIFNRLSDVGLSNMTPRFSTQHHCNGFFIHTHEPRNCTNRSSVSVHFSKLYNSGIAQLGIRVQNASCTQLRRIFTKHSKGVKQILRMRAPLKVAQRVVRHDAVLVVDERPAWVSAYKSQQNEPVHFAGTLSTVFHKCNLQITLPIWVWLQNSTIGSSTSQMAHYATVIANAIATFVTRDCFPLLSFDNWLRHVRPFGSRLICSGVRGGDNHSDAGILCAAV